MKDGVKWKVEGRLPSWLRDQPGLRIEVQELKRSADTLLVRFALINDSTDAFAPNAKLGGLTSGTTPVGSTSSMVPTKRNTSWSSIQERSASAVRASSRCQPSPD